MHLQTINQDSSAAFIAPEEIPVYSQNGIKCRILLGEYAGLENPLSRWNAEITLLDCYHDGTSDASLALDISSFQRKNLKTLTCWVYVLEDTQFRGAEHVSVTLPAETHKLQKGDLFVTTGCSVDSSISINSPANTFTHFIVGLSAPFHQPWVKLLGHDGAIITPDDMLARQKMKEYEGNENNFGKGL